MGPINDTEEIVRNMSFKAGVQIDEDLRASILKEQTQETTGARSLLPRGPFFKIAVAAAVIVALAVVIGEFGGRNGHGSTALADMVRTMQQQPWVHYTVTSVVSGETVSEYWLGFDPPVQAYRLQNGKLSYRRGKEGIGYTLDPQKKVIYAAQVSDLGRQEDQVPDSRRQCCAGWTKKLCMRHIRCF